MKKILILGMVLVLGLCNISFASGAKANTYQLSTWVDSNTTSRVVTFPYTVRDLILRNDDSTDSVWVSLNRSSLTGWSPALLTSGSILLTAGSEIDFYDVMIDYVAIQYNSATASPVTVIAAY